MSYSQAKDDLYQDPDTDLARRPIILSQVQTALVFGLVALLALIFTRPSRTFWLGFLLAVIYWTDRKFFVLRAWELNERLKRMEHKLNDLTRAGTAGLATDETSEGS